MANSIFSSDVLTNKHGRPFLQLGGARPNNPLYYYGAETGYLGITGVTNPIRGGVTRINAHDPNKVGEYIAIGTTIEPPDFPEGTLQIYEKKGALPRYLMSLGCWISTYIVRGECKSLADFDFGSEAYIEVYEDGLVTELSQGDRFAIEGDDPLVNELTVIWRRIYSVGQMQFGERNAATIAREITDVVYASRQVCGQCGPANDGSQWIYAVETGAAGAPPIVYYSLNGGGTWTASNITPANNAEPIVALRVMGNYLIALSAISQGATQGGYYYILINPATGAPSGAWTEVTTGFTNAREPRDMVVLGPREAFICCDGGEILKVVDPPAGATSVGIFTASDLGRISASSDGNTIVAAGTVGAVIKSINRGQSFSAVTTAPSANTITAIQALDEFRYWAGDSAGGLFYTLDGGEAAWTTQLLPGLTATAIQDIKFATGAVGYVALTIAGTLGRLIGTVNGGRSWFPSSVTGQRLVGVPNTVTQRYNRMAFPGVNDGNIAANYLALAGLGATTDGALMTASPNVF